MRKAFPDAGDYCVRLADLPPRVKAFTSVDDCGFANIYINSRLSREEQRKALIHELHHIHRGDFTSAAAIRAVET